MAAFHVGCALITGKSMPDAARDCHGVQLTFTIDRRGRVDLPLAALLAETKGTGL